METSSFLSSSAHSQRQCEGPGRWLVLGRHVWARGTAAGVVCVCVSGGGEEMLVESVLISIPEYMVGLYTCVSILMAQELCIANYSKVSIASYTSPTNQFQNSFKSI